MKIWIVNHYATPPSLSGLVRHYYFTKYLKEKGNDVKLFSSSYVHNTNINFINDKSLFKNITVDMINYTFVKTRTYKKNNWRRILNMLEFPLNMWRISKIFNRPDIIYASSPSPFSVVIAILIGKKYKIPVITEIRDLWPQTIVDVTKFTERNLIIKLLFVLEKWIYKNSDSIVFTMEGGKNYIVDKKWNKDIDLNKIYHINNGVDLEEFEFNKLNFKVEDKDLKSDKFKVIFTGSVRKVYDLEKIVEVARELKNRTSNILILIYGDGTEKERLVNLCKKYNLENIVFKGKVEKKYIPYILSCSDLNLLHLIDVDILKYGSSWNKLFDYLASGKPILCDVNANFNIMLKQEVGIITEDQRIKTLVDSIIKIYEMKKTNIEKYNEYCDNARKLVKEYDYRNLTNKLENIFLNLKGD